MWENTLNYFKKFLRQHFPASMEVCCVSLWLGIYKFKKISVYYHCFWASQVAQTVKNMPAIQETWDRSLCWQDPLEKGIATHSIILAWRIPWTEEPGELQSYSPWSHMELNTAGQLTYIHTSLFLAMWCSITDKIGKKNFCLFNLTVRWHWISRWISIS